MATRHYAGAARSWHSRGRTHVAVLLMIAAWAPWPRPRAFAGLSARSVGRQPHHCLGMKATIRSGETVLVAGSASYTGRILISMLKDAGLVPRPLLANLKSYDDPEEFFGPGVEPFIYDGKNPLPPATGFVSADEGYLDAKVVGALMRKLQASGKLARVVLLSSRRPQNFLQSIGGGEKEERLANEEVLVEACKEAGAEYTLVRAGILRGGGSRTDSSHGLGKDFYNTNADNVQGLEEEMFDLKQRGMSNEDPDENDFFRSPLTNRLTAATVIANCLKIDKAGNRAINVVAAESKKFPTSAEVEKAFKAKEDTKAKSEKAAAAPATTAAAPAVAAPAPPTHVPTAAELQKLKKQVDLMQWAANSLATKGDPQAAEMQAKAQRKFESYQALKEAAR